jgi:hypothetical protein
MKTKPEYGPWEIHPDIFTTRVRGKCLHLLMSQPLGVPVIVPDTLIIVALLDNTIAESLRPGKPGSVKLSMTARKAVYFSISGFSPIKRRPSNIGVKSGTKSPGLRKGVCMATVTASHD